MKELVIKVPHLPLIFRVCMVNLSDVNYDFISLDQILLDSLVSTNLQINFHSYINLNSRDLYLGFRGVLPHGTFSIGNLTSRLRLGFQK